MGYVSGSSFANQLHIISALIAVLLIHAGICLLYTLAKTSVVMNLYHKLVSKACEFLTWTFYIR
jgi:hypothetical protein